MPQRILVVDDDRSIVKVLRGYLEQSGYLVLTAYDGDLAMKTLRSERPDLVILDVMMPNKDGWAVTRLVRADIDVKAIVNQRAASLDAGKIAAAARCRAVVVGKPEPIGARCRIGKCSSSDD